MRVEWRGDAGCEAPLDLTGEVARLTRPNSGPPEDWSFEVVLTQQASGAMLLDFAAHGAQSSGRKRLELGSCREAREAVVLLIAMTLDPEVGGTSEAEPPSPGLTPPEPQEERPAVLPTHDEPVLSGSLGASLVFDPWSLGKPSAGPAAFARLSFRTLQLHLAASYLFPREFDPLPAGASGKVDLFLGALGAGLRFGGDKVLWGPQVEVELGALRGRASGVADARTQATLWASALAGLWLEVPAVGRLGARFSVQGGVPLRRPRFGFQGGPIEYTAPVAFLRVHLGLVFRFGGPKE